MDWLSQARCKGQPTEIFFAGDNERGAKLRRNVSRAKQICWSCPVLAACRNYALDTHEPYGIWGALTPSERRQVRDSNSKRVNAPVRQQYF
jgi:WhiB family redox-sensing transcriptional regulator